MLFFVATVTPFDARGRPDLARLRAHVLWLASQGVEGFVPTSTVGEFLYLSDREQEAVHRTVLDAARGLPVYPCVWHPSLTTMHYLFEAARTDEDPTVRAAAIDAINLSGQTYNFTNWLPPLLESEQNYLVKIACCDLVGELKLEDHIPFLIGCLLEASGDLQRAAKRNLDKFLEDPANQSFGYDAAKWGEWHGG